MKKHAEKDVISAIFLYEVCKKILANSIGNNGRDLSEGEFLSRDAVREVREVIHLTSPAMTPCDRETTAIGICRGLIMAVRFIEAERELASAPQGAPFSMEDAFSCRSSDYIGHGHCEA